jgi:hypothetical protein
VAIQYFIRYRHLGTLLRFAARGCDNSAPSLEHDGTLSPLQRAGRELAFANSRLRVAGGETVADADEFLYFALEAEVEVVSGLL